VNIARAFPPFRSGLVIVLLAAVLSGCGSNDDSGPSAATTTPSAGTTTSGNATSLDEWAAGLCQAVASWEASVQSTSAKMSSSQDSFQSASDAITSANEALVGSLEGLGTPPAPASTQAKDAIDELSASLEKGSGEIDQALNGTFSTQSEIAKASAQVRTSISKMNGAISKTVNELKALPDEEGWKQSFQQVAACKAVANG
jgi:hypothetical protein